MTEAIILGLVAGATSVVVLATIAAERWHSQAFKTHTDRLETLAERDDHDALGEEIKRFHDDRRVDVAMWVMQWGNLLAVVLAGITGSLAVGMFI